MKKIEFWLHRFVFVYGLIMLSTFFMCLLFNPTSELPVVTFFGRCILLTLVSMLTLLIYTSGEELSNREWWIRTLLHAILLEAVLLPLAHNWGFWYNTLVYNIYSVVVPHNDSGGKGNVASYRLRTELLHGGSVERTDPEAQAGGDPERRVEQWIKRIGYAARSVAAKHAP